MKVGGQSDCGNKKNSYGSLKKVHTWHSHCI